MYGVAKNPKMQIQKDSEVRLKIIGTRVDATEIIQCYRITITLLSACPSFGVVVILKCSNNRGFPSRNLNRKDGR
uniref:Uncharacterized protein n=1 Tax=Tanacetum cinerariifolium TaxID=118510 RepID=A0A6L2LES2_TANCI|nr:hypothetical protein [Tanacetum cinerariifolium]